jgi:release factor glutamine methyltransferase
METRAINRDAEPVALDVRAALREGILRLRDARVPSHTLAAELLLMHALGRDRTWLYSHPESFVDRDKVKKYLTLIEGRAAGEPTQYLTGKQEFWGLEFEVNSAVLIPRPETEHVVEVALERMARRSTDADAPRGARANEKSRVIDVGTGSGCIAIALAGELPHAEIFATDISSFALEVARRNAARHGVADRIRFVECDLLRGVGLGSTLTCSEPSRRATRQSPPSFDLIVSNPPYVSRHDATQLPREVHDHEPHAALFGGPAGTEIYSRLIEQSASALLPGGILVLELGYNCAPHVRGLLAGNRAWTAIAIANDLRGIPRVISAQRAQTSA